MKKIQYFVWPVLFLGLISYGGYQFYAKHIWEKEFLKQMIARLEADSRIAEVVVTDVQDDQESGQRLTTIKFLEFDGDGNPLTPKYFTFAGNLIQFQSLVVRFADLHIKSATALKGRSVYLFWKVFVLKGTETQEFEITKINEIPQGYKIQGIAHPYEKKFWENFWQHALDPKKAQSQGIKNAQLEAPGAKFIPGILYTLKIEHDGGIRIDASPIPEILRGEKILE